jgi:hypothetical protein
MGGTEIASMVRPLRTGVTKDSGVNALGEDTRWRNSESCSFIDLFIAGGEPIHRCPVCSSAPIYFHLKREPLVDWHIRSERHSKAVNEYEKAVCGE